MSSTAERLGYDIESPVPRIRRLRFIDLKGRLAGADVVAATRNQILCARSKPDDFILGLVESERSRRICYVRRPFQREPVFDVKCVSYGFARLLVRAGGPP